MSFLKSLFGKSEWDSIEQDMTYFLRQKISISKFTTFTILCEKYCLFEQLSQICNSETGFGPKRGLDLRITNLVCFLTNVGNELAQQSEIQGHDILKDGIEFSKTVLLINHNHWPARFDLALGYMIIVKTKEAQKEAKQALSDFDKELANNQSDSRSSEFEELFPEYVRSEEENRHSRAMLIDIIEGRMPQ